MHFFAPETPWRLDPSVTFLNHGSFGACPVPVLERQRALIDELESQPVAFLQTTMDARMSAAREAVAAFLNADPEGLAFVQNATTGVSTVLRSLPFDAGDELLTTNHEYNATLNALAEVARHSGARVVRADLPLEVGSDDAVVAAVLDAVTPRTRLALISHITSPTATILPIEILVRELAERGVDTLVDAAHAPGQVPVDLTALGASYWTGNGHKWLCAPKGSAVLHVRSDRRDRIRPLTISHGWNDPRPDRPRLWKEFDWTGTPDPSPALTLPAAIDLVGHLHPDGWPGLMSSNHRLAIEGRRRIASALGVETTIPPELHGSMAIVRLPIEATDAAAQRLHDQLQTDERIEVPITAFPVRAARATPTDDPTALAVRISAQRYNEPSDYDRLAEALVRLIR